MPSPLLSFLSASLLALADLGLLWAGTRSLGARPPKSLLALLTLGVVFKLALLAGGFWWLNRQPWFAKPWGMAGLLAPFALFVAWQALALQLRHGRRA